MSSAGVWAVPIVHSFANCVIACYPARLRGIRRRACCVQDAGARRAGESPCGADLRETAYRSSGYHDEVFHDHEHLGRILTGILDDASAA